MQLGLMEVPHLYEEVSEKDLKCTELFLVKGVVTTSKINTADTRSFKFFSLVHIDVVLARNMERLPCALFHVASECILTISARDSNPNLSK